MAKTVKFDLNSLTLGEMAAAEEASGLTYKQLLDVTAYRVALVLMISALRNDEPAPSWQSLMSRRVFDVGSSTSPLPQDSPSPK